jgi:hypothetical protein
MEEVATEWAKVLTGLTVDDLKHGLDKWDSKYPPNVMEFRDLCRERRGNNQPRPQTIPASQMCAAHDCPLPGSMSHSTNGGGSFYCRYHFREPDFMKWPKISEDLRLFMQEREPF